MELVSVNGGARDRMATHVGERTRKRVCVYMKNIGGARGPNWFDND